MAVRFLAAISLHLCGAVLLAGVMGRPALAAPSAEVFGAMPAIRDADVSPAGDRIATLQSEGEETYVIVRDANSGAILGRAVTPKAGRAAGLVWYNNDRVFVFMRGTFNFGSNVIFDFCRIFSMSADAKQAVVLLGRDETVFPRLGGCGLISLKGPEPDTVLIAGANLKDRIRGTRRVTSDVYSVNVVTGNGTIVEGGKGRTLEWIADREGQIRIRVDVAPGKKTVFARMPGSQEFVQIFDGRFFDFDDDGGSQQVEGTVDFLGFGQDPNLVYVRISHQGRSAIAQFDLANKRLLPPVFSDAVYDVGGLRQLRNGRIIGATIVRTRPEQEYFTDDWRKLQSVLRESFPNDYLRIAGSSDDVVRHVILAEGPEAPGGEYWLLDLKTNETKTIGSLYSGIGPGSVQPPKYIKYTARDGTQIPAYLTLPPGASGRNMAAIVLPHGGPASRDSGDFDWLSQFLATRGYAVLQPQFRGSTGFGRAWAKAGERQWGALMQDDVSDGVKHLVQSGIADPKRICIAGWSYGGYAAGAGATLTPELYRCIIAGAGVFDLVEMLRDERRTASWLTNAYWRNHIGDLKSDREKMNAMSPAKLAAKVQSPVLLIHGKLDTIVPFEQSEIMAAALKDANKAYELVELEGADHSLSYAVTRIKMLKAMEAFLLKHNPPN